MPHGQCNTRADVLRGSCSSARLPAHAGCLALYSVRLRVSDVGAVPCSSPYHVRVAQCALTNEMKKEFTDILSELYLLDADGKIVSVGCACRRRLVSWVTAAAAEHGNDKERAHACLANAFDRSPRTRPPVRRLRNTLAKLISPVSKLSARSRRCSKS